MTVSRRTLISGLAPAALQLTAGAAWSKGHRLQLSAAYGDGIFHTQNLRNFAARVGADTQQALEIDVVSNSALKPMAQVLPALKRNEIQFGEVLMSSYVDIHPLLAMDSLPFIVRGFDEAAHLWQLTRPVLQEFLLAAGCAPAVCRALAGAGPVLPAPGQQHRGSQGAQAACAKRCDQAAGGTLGSAAGGARGR